MSNIAAYLSNCRSVTTLQLKLAMVWTTPSAFLLLYFLQQEGECVIDVVLNEGQCVYAVREWGAIVGYYLRHS